MAITPAFETVLIHEIDSCRVAQLSLSRVCQNASRECSCEEDNVTEEVNSATGNWGIAEEETEAKVCS